MKGLSPVLTLLRWRPVFSKLLGFLLIVSLLGCATTKIAPAPPSPQEPWLSKMLGQMENLEPREESQIIVGVDEQGTSLFAWSVDQQKQLWSKKIRATSVPVVAGSWVFCRSDETMIVRNLLTGDLVAELDESGDLVGADGNEEMSIVALDLGAESRTRAVLVGLNPEGVLWRRTFPMAIGQPSIADGVVVIPWASGRISLLEAETGLERARVQLKDGVISRAFVDGISMYGAGIGLYRIDTRLISGIKEAALYYEPVRRTLPTQPTLARLGNKPLPGPDDAWHRARYEWKPVLKGDKIEFSDGLIYFLFHRLVFAFESDTDRVRWVRGLDNDLVTATAFEGGIACVDLTGELIVLGAKDGGERLRSSMGRQVRSAAISVSKFKLEDAKKSKAGLKNQLMEAAAINDDRLSLGRALALNYLARDDDETITKYLVDVCGEANVPSMVRKTACDELTTRKKGLRHVRSALKTRGSYFDDISPPPAGPLALAAASMNGRGVIPDLMSHLHDPATTSSNLVGVLAALGELGNKTTAGEIEAFVTYYKAQTKDAQLTKAVLAGMDSVVLLRKKGALQFLERIEKSGIVNPRVKQKARELRVQLVPEPKPEVKIQPKPEVEKVDPRPERITEEIVKTILGPVREKLMLCIPDGVSQSKLVIVVSESGKLKSVNANPESVQKCALPIIKTRAFPATRRETSQKIVYLISK